MPLAVFSRPGYCSHCQAWLGENEADSTRERTTRPSEENDVALRHAEAIGELLANAPHLNGSPLRAAFMTNFRACVDGVAEGNRLAFARTCGVSLCVVQSQMVGNRLPRIDTLVRICFHLNIPLTALLESSSTHFLSALARRRTLSKEIVTFLYRALPNRYALYSKKRCESNQPPVFLRLFDGWATKDRSACTRWTEISQNRSSPTTESQDEVIGGGSLGQCESVLSPKCKSCWNNRLPRNGRSLSTTLQPVWGTPTMATFSTSFLTCAEQFGERSQLMTKLA